MFPGKRGAGRLLYVVDDELLLAQILEAILKLEGFEVKRFTDPLEAWQSFEREPAKPEALVTDYAMEPLTGLELLGRCRALAPAMRCVMVSGNAGLGGFESAPVKPDAFLEKPFLPQTLIATVHEVLAKQEPA